MIGVMLCGFLAGMVPPLAHSATIRYRESSNWTQTAPDNIGPGWQNVPEVPTTADLGRLNWGGSVGNTVTLNTEQEIGSLEIGVNESGTLVVRNGGILTTVRTTTTGETNGRLNVGNNDPKCQGTLVVDEGGSVFTQGNLQVGSATLGTATIAGTVTVGAPSPNEAKMWMQIGRQAVGVVDVSGTLTVTNHLWMGSESAAGIGTLTITGTVVVGGNIGLGTINANTASGGSGTIRVNSGGLLDLSNWSAWNPTANDGAGGGSIQPGSRIDIAGGTVRIKGNREAQVDAYVALGRIVAYGGSGLIQRAFDSAANLTTLTSIPPETNFRLTIVANGGNYDFTWDSQEGMVYDLVSATDLASPISEWPVYDPDGDGGNPPYGNLPAAGAITSLANVPGDGPRRFFAVVEREAPPPVPVLSANFEDDDGGFTLVGAPNDWAWGPPQSDNADGLQITAGNGGSGKCWGTNLGDGASPSGGITPGTNSILRSPAIDLTGVSGAKLSFAAAVDALEEDTFEVLVKDVDTGTVLDTIRPFTFPHTATWTALGPFELTAGDGKQIYLEFRFLGTDVQYIGCYLDDVLVTRP